MTNSLKTRLAAGIAISGLALVAAPAAAQVNGVATVDSAVAIASSTPLQTGYQQIGVTFQAERAQVDERQLQRNTIAQTLDTDGDGQLNEAEAAVANDPENATVKQLQAIEQEIAQIQNPINRARVYVVEQVAQQYAASLQQVITDKNIQLIVAPDTVIYMQPEVDVTSAVADVINTRIPAVSSAPPANWQPAQQSVQLFQQIQQVLVLAARQQAAAQAAAAQPAAAPAAPAASGR